MKKNRLSIVSAFAFLFAVIGCNLSERLDKAVDNSNISVANMSNSNAAAPANKTLSERAADKILDEKLGIPECDDLIEDYVSQDKKENEGYIEKARRQYFENTIREQLKKNIQLNKNNKKEMAATCLQLKEQLDSFKPKEETNTNEPTL